MIVALAGRRIDAVDAEVRRFPPETADEVRQRIRAVLVERQAHALVCSAACGTDLLALDVAGKLGIRRRVVLPFAPEVFRLTSVVDRPGHWGALFDRICDEVRATGDLVVLPELAEPHTAYARTNTVILDEAVSLASPLETNQNDATAPGMLAIVAWDGAPRGEGDLTAAFAEEARARGIPVVELSTL